MVTHDGNMLGMDVCRGKDMHILESLRSTLVMEFVFKQNMVLLPPIPPYNIGTICIYIFSHFYVTNISRYTRKG